MGYFGPTFLKLHKQLKITALATAVPARPVPDGWYSNLLSFYVKNLCIIMLVDNFQK